MNFTINIYFYFIINLIHLFIYMKAYYAIKIFVNIYVKALLNIRKMYFFILKIFVIQFTTHFSKLFI